MFDEKCRTDARYIVRWNNSIRDLAWDRLTRDMLVECAEIGCENKKRGGGSKGTRERNGRNSGEEGKGDERGGKTSEDIFRKELGKPKRPVEFHTMAFRATVKRATYHARKWNPYPTYDLPFFLSPVLSSRI